MGTQDDMKVREWYYLKEFKDSYLDFPLGTIKPCESPDFLVFGPDRTVGIELEGYVRGQGSVGSPLREKEEFEARVAYEAGLLYQSHSSIPLNVSLHWDLFTPRHTQPADLLATYAARIVARYCPVNPGEHALLTWHQLRDSPLEGVVHYIQVQRSPEGLENFWVSGESGGVDAEPMEIQNLIDRKNEKVEKYLEKCDLVWLLIFTGGHISQTAHLTDAVHNHTFHSRFSKVVFYDGRGGAWGWGLYQLGIRT